MLNGLSLLLSFVRAALRDRRELALENLALRQQLIVLKRTDKRPRIQNKDRLFWIWLSRTWSGWRRTLLIVQPATIVGWHRQGFRHYWARRSQCKTSGRPSVSPQLGLWSSRWQRPIRCGEHHA